jgi:hypothetical protein
MNKRIKELYTEATAWALHNYPPPVNPFEWEDLRSKKFAELIVKECAKLLDEDSYLMPELGGYAHDMRKMFGVKE